MDSAATGGGLMELLGTAFVQRALLAGLLIGLLTSYYGVFVVQRRLSFLGNGLAHAAFGGVALGLLLDWQPLWVAVPFTVLAAVGIIWVQQRTRIGGDTAIGIFFATSMALGVLFLSLRRTYSADAFSILFGDLLFINRADLWAAAAMLLATLAMLPMWGRWAYATFDRELSAADRLPVLRDDYLLAVCLAVTVVIASKLVGIVLVAAMLVIPAATARQLAPTFRLMTLASLGVSVAGVLAGMLVSLQANLPAGPSVILVQATLFFLAAFLRR
jgi:zinc transport system permease protein